MRITVVCSDPEVRIPGAEGASLQLRSIASALAEVGHEVLLVGARGRGEPEDHSWRARAARIRDLLTGPSLHPALAA